MNNKILFVTVAIILALSVLCVFCPLVASADSPSDEFPDYSIPFQGPSGQWNNDSVVSLGNLIDKAYKCNLLGGSFPIIAYSRSSTGVIDIIAVSAKQMTERPKTDIIQIYTSGKTITAYLTGSNSQTQATLDCFTLLNNGTLVCKSSDLSSVTLNSSDRVGVIWKFTSNSYIPYTQSSFSHLTGGESTANLGNIIGAYDRILNGYSVGGDGYDEGYNAGYEIGYNNGVTIGREYGYNDGYSVGHDIGYETGYDIGYETGYDNGWETGYDVGFDHGVDMGEGLGYTEGYDDGYETGYWDGWDDGYDDGYERGELDASPIVIDIPSVITSVPQSAKAVIDNAFGFELFGINIAGLLSVLLIVAIIGFVVRWLMSR